MNIKFTKLFFACLAVVMCMSTGADAQKKLCLKEIQTQIEGDYTYFGYTADGKLDSTYNYTSYNDEELYFLFKYDEKGNLVKTQGFCIIPNEDSEYHEFTKTYEIDYGYDENGRKISRKNYNLDVYGGTGQYLLGGVYRYIYDEKGNLSQRKLFWDEAETDLFETANYTYDENGRLITESYLQHSFGSSTESMLLTYMYNENGKLVRLRTDVLNYETGLLEEDDNLAYTYDEKGNLISRKSYGKNPDNPNEEHILVYYTDTLSTDVAMPINLEDDMDFYTLSTNVIKQDSIYRRDAEGATFDLYDVQEWNYANLDEASGIESVLSNEGKILGVSRDAEGNVVLNGIQNNENVRVFDAQGRIVRNGAYNGKVNLDNLPAGMYIVATRNGCVKVSR